MVRKSIYSINSGFNPHHKKEFALIILLTNILLYNNRLDITNLSTDYDKQLVVLSVYETTKIQIQNYIFLKNWN